MPPRAVRFGYEVQIVRRGRLERSLERRQPWVRDRSWRQTGMLVGVVLVRTIEVGAIDRASIALLQHGSIDCRRVAIERHTQPEPVKKHGGYLRPFVRNRSLFLHQRSESHGVVHGRWMIRLLYFPPILAELIGHHLAKLLHCR